jgi:hypothetical protein
VEWGKFMIGDLFEKVKVKSLKYKTSELPSEKNNEYNLPALTAWIINQWLNNHVPKENATILKNVISISANGANTGATFYQNKEFTVLQDAYAIDWIYSDDILTDNQYLFLTSSISNLIYWKYDWSNKAGWEKIKDLEISIPTKNWQINFEFMESFIEDLEKERIKELNNYLEVSWLKDYTLTSVEEKVLADFESGKFEWGEFNYTSIWFNLLKVKNKLSKSDFVIWWNIPVYSSDSSNNWIIWYIKNEAEFFISYKNPFYLIFWDHTRSFNIATSDFSVADNVKVLSINDKFTIKNLLYIISSWKKCIPNKGYSRHWSIAKESIFQLPIKNGEADFKIMETLISAVQKMVIKDMVNYVDDKMR